jgi:hypothetical protein
LALLGTLAVLFTSANTIFDTHSDTSFQLVKVDAESREIRLIALNQGDRTSYFIQGRFFFELPNLQQLEESLELRQPVNHLIERGASSLLLQPDAEDDRWRFEETLVRIVNADDPTINAAKTELRNSRAGKCTILVKSRESNSEDKKVSLHVPANECNALLQSAYGF